jgi:hypothetical protein
MSPDQAERVCSNEVQRRMNVRNQDVDVIYQREDSNRNNYRVDWRVKNRGNDSRGSCLVSQNGRIEQFNGGNGGNYNGNGKGNGNYNGNGNYGGGRPGGGFPGNGNGGFNPPPAVNFPATRVDTAGRGTFNGKGITANVTRGWVDTSNSTVQLTGDRNFKVTFSGVIERSNGNGFTFRITNSNLGGAQGTAQVTLNGDRNEVQSINVDGRINGDRFQANFNR